jgi:nucleoside-diphosphate-sugar epimerase
MRALFIGGTGTISSACAALAVERGIELTLFNRGRRPIAAPKGVELLQGDIDSPAGAEILRGRAFDTVVNWVAYRPEQIERDIALFRDHTKQYVFISSCSVYRKPTPGVYFTEEMPLANPDWEYAHAKILCEERLRHAIESDGFPATIVRPSHTYGPGLIPAAFNNSAYPWTIVNRLRRGKKVIVHGDGTSLWTLTYNADFARGFVPLLCNPATLSEAIHITSDEALTWDRITQLVARAAGVEARIVHVPSDVLHALTPGGRGTLLGDKMHCGLFDTAKLRRFVPDFHCDVPFEEGIRHSLAWFKADPARQVIDEQFDALTDSILEKMEALTQR